MFSSTKLFFIPSKTKGFSFSCILKANSRTYNMIKIIYEVEEDLSNMDAVPNCREEMAFKEKVLNCLIFITQATLFNALLIMFS